MKVEYSVTTSHTREALREILSDPVFVLPRIFKSIKNVQRDRSSYWGSASFLGISHEFHGNVYTSYSRIMYVFQLRRREGELGNGRIVFNLKSEGSLQIEVEYEGWMEKTSLRVLKRWMDEFISVIDEEIRLERIKRKI
ncbi:DUF3211 domain-containing protein [Stygiolobus caldivivus]|uniref:DUF3211 domain-containing protein n=1 Tax=Stygiolobus caldivivus TaxID=2824673 RepID=A0A8D5U3M7_9CREN|nr:DUF3211 domain-containing protein [Stygiolobus caldivivus]BCU68815.1 hypothetical protein KN1_01120 [Stygiolobus caldivivus]